MYSYGPPHMAGQKQDDQHEHTFSSYVRIRDVALKTCQRRWTIGKSGERGSGISVLATWHDDDDIYTTVLLLERNSSITYKGWYDIKQWNKSKLFIYIYGDPLYTYCYGLLTPSFSNRLLVRVDQSTWPVNWDKMTECYLT